MRYGSVGDYAKPKWDAMLEILKTAGKGEQEIKIYTATIGLSGDKLCSSMSTSSDAPYYGFNYEANEDGTQIKFTQLSTVSNKAGKDYYKKILNNPKAFANSDIFGTHFYGTPRNKMDFPELES